MTIPVFIGTYTRREAFVDGQGEGIYRYAFDPSTGALNYRATTPGVINPSFLALDPGKFWLYAVNEIPGGTGETATLSAFTIDPDTLELRSLDRRPVHGAAPCYVSLGPQSRCALVANYETGSLCVLPIREDGGLEEAVDVVQLHGKGAHPTRQQGPHAHMITPGPGGAFIYAVDLGADRVLWYTLDSERGRLLPVSSPGLQLPGGTGPRHLAFHPQQPYAYLIGELNSTVTVLSVDRRSGELHPRQVVSTLPEGFEGPNLGAALQVAPAGKFLYASNRGHDSLAIFEIESQSGTLTPAGFHSSGGRTPRFFTFDPGGNFLLVANQDSGTVVTFRVDPESGALAQTGFAVEVPTPVCLQFLV